jgi:anti-sigma factor RsiW
MSAPCPHPIPWEDLVAYWADDLEPADLDRVEEHLMGCAGCSVTSASVAAIAGALRAMIPPIISTTRLAELRALGLRVVENPMSPGQRKPVIFGTQIDLLVHRLAGLDLSSAEHVRVTISIESTGAVVRDDPDVPFDRAAGAVLIACQRHFAALPPDIVFEVRARGPLGEEPVARYEVPHTFL